MMKAYYIDFAESFNQCSIDIGIGSIDYWEYKHDDVCIIAKNRAEAWKIYIGTLGGEREDGREARPTDFRIKSTWDYNAQLTFITLLDDVEGEAGLVRPFSGHMLCDVVQNSSRVPHYARYLYGDHKNPLWSGAAEWRRDEHIPIDTDMPWERYWPPIHLDEIPF